MLKKVLKNAKNANTKKSVKKIKIVRELTSQLPILYVHKLELKLDIVAQTLDVENCGVCN